jgi:hypothetical protein
VKEYQEPKLGIYGKNFGAFWHLKNGTKHGLETLRSDFPQTHRSIRRKESYDVVKLQNSKKECDYKTRHLKSKCNEIKTNWRHTVKETVTAAHKAHFLSCGKLLANLTLTHFLLHRMPRVMWSTYSIIIRLIKGPWTQVYSQHLLQHVWLDIFVNCSWVATGWQ